MGRTKRSSGMLYDLYEGDELLGKYEAAEIADIACCTRNAVYNAASTGGLLSGIYHVDYGLPPNFRLTCTTACRKPREALRQRREAMER